MVLQVTSLEFVKFVLDYIECATTQFSYLSFWN